MLIELLLSPIILFFVLGFVAKLLKSNLTIPEQVSKTLSLYLMMAIGFKGGVGMAQAGFSFLLLKTIGIGVLAGVLIPIIAFYILGKITRLDRVNQASIAAHYGSISVVTFVAATEYLAHVSMVFDPFLIAIVAVMEVPAIIVGLWLAQEKGDEKSKIDFREVFLNGSIVLLVGSLFVGMLTGPAGLAAVSPFLVVPFKGVLCFFLLNMGLIAAQNLKSAKQLNFRLVLFGLTMPLIGATVGLLFSMLIGLSVGSTVLIMTLCGSASYIAVPAALRISLPEANLAYPLSLSLGVTFPFNLIAGIPLYYFVALLLI